MSNNNNSILLCSFINRNPFILARCIRNIKKYSGERFGYVFVLESKEEPDQLFLVYNSNGGDRFPLRGTIHVSRNKSTNTIYTITALNEAVKLEENQEVLTSKGVVKLSWEKYRNTLLVAPKDANGEAGLKVHHTKLVDVINL